MRIRSLANTGDITCGDEVLEQVTAFTYLGSFVSTTGSSKEDVEARCRRGQAAFCMLGPVWRSKCISLWTKLRIVSSNGKRVLLYRSETLRLTKRAISKLQTFINCRLCYIMGVWWPRRVSNKQFLQCTKQERVEVTIQRRKWGWIGHTLRKPAPNITWQSLKWNPEGVRKRGRPKKSWRRRVQKEFKNIGLSWEVVKRTAQNRVQWKSVVEALCSGWSKGD